MREEGVNGGGEETSTGRKFGSIVRENDTTVRDDNTIVREEDTTVREEDTLVSASSECEEGGAGEDRSSRKEVGKSRSVATIAKVGLCQRSKESQSRILKIPSLGSPSFSLNNSSHQMRMF